MGKLKESIEIEDALRSDYIMHTKMGFFVHDEALMSKISQKMRMIKRHVDEIDTFSREITEMIYELEDELVMARGII
jgi:hypothetical protein